MMKKTLLIAMLILGVIILSLGLRATYVAYDHYRYFWDAKAANPDTLIISKNLKAYDDSWIYFIYSSMASLIGLTFIYLSDKNLAFKITLIKKRLYTLAFILIILIPFYYTFFDSKYPFDNKLMQLDMEKRYKDNHRD